MVVAGGGGGAGAVWGGDPNARGGDGGAAEPGSPSAGSGGQGTAVAGGAAGIDPYAGVAAPGALGVGGAGVEYVGGGGGGGGLYGGGGGSADFFGLGGFGGGGGSSYADPAAIDVVMTAGSHQGDGQVTISYVVGSGRAVDTRGGTRLLPGLTRTFDLSSSGVPDGASAVEVNLTVDAPTSAGYLTAYPCGASVPTSSNLNFVAGQTTSNSAIIPLGTDGDICVVSTVATDLLVDVLRYFDSSTDRLTGTAPARLFDSRFARTSVIPAGSIIEVTAAGVPIGATSAVVHLTATQSGGPGYVTAYACGTATPNRSNLNTDAGRDVANRATVDLPGSGKLCLYNSVATHLIVDLDAAYTGSVGASISAVAPARIRDTRIGARPAADGVTEVAVGDAGISAAALNITVDGVDLPGYLTVWPCDQTKPATSNGNYVARAATASALTKTASATGTICVATSTAAHIVVDLQARFTAVI